MPPPIPTGSAGSQPDAATVSPSLGFAADMAPGGHLPPSAPAPLEPSGYGLPPVADHFSANVNGAVAEPSHDAQAVPPSALPHPPAEHTPPPSWQQPQPQAQTRNNGPDFSTLPPSIAASLARLAGKQVNAGPAAGKPQTAPSPAPVRKG